MTASLKMLVYIFVYIPPFLKKNSDKSYYKIDFYFKVIKFSKISSKNAKLDNDKIATLRTFFKLIKIIIFS